MKYKHLIIEYCNPTDHADSVELYFKLVDTDFTDRWVDRVELAKTMYTIDDAGRFYGFGSVESQISDAITRINACISVINADTIIIDRELTDISDQNTLNYLHHIFEVHHGLLDEQNSEFWQNCAYEAKCALSDLNILVHRCEAVARGQPPRHVVTWYGLPKTEFLQVADYALFDDTVKFGSVYLNYVEIGKTLSDLSNDNDTYIGDDAFKPYRHFSADFNVKFWDSSETQVCETRTKIQRYYSENVEFFEKKHNMPWGHPFLNLGTIPLAHLENHSDVITKLTTRQWVKSVTFK